MENAMQNSNGVELTLPGMTKTWVRNKGEWRDKSLIQVKTTAEVTIHEPVEKKSRGWKFWKKREVESIEIDNSVEDDGDNMLED